MDGNQSSILVLFGMTGLVFLQNQACQTKSGTNSELENSDVVTDLLAGVGPSVVLPSLEQFSEELEALELSLDNLHSEIEGDGSSETISELKSTSQEQWKSAMNVWQKLEVMQVGPAGSSLKFIAGQDLRDEIYSWPTINACRIDQKTADMSWQDSVYFEDNLVNAYGLDAIEHLLFAGSDSTCPSQVDPIANGSWAELGPDGIETNRVQFALVLVEELQSQTDALLELWSEDGGDFSTQLTVSDDSSPYESKEEALNQVYNALFFLETTKDQKLAIPLGYKECAELDEEGNQSVCPESLEGTVSYRSLDSIVANIQGFKLLFTGGEGTGFDDLLIDLGHADLSTQIIADVDATIALAQEFEEPLETALVNDFDRVESFYESLALVTTALKVDMPTILQVEIPKEASGDND
jgi:predicted lipoprotein